ncbi:MAG: hypothetical protein IJT09_02780 [Abditibacteriota bacterium]|nr:hypothetical protein [Abditibacteriota bacterium]
MNRLEELEAMRELYEAGYMTEEQFEKKKKEIFDAPDEDFDDAVNDALRSEGNNDPVTEYDYSAPSSHSRAKTSNAVLVIIAVMAVALALCISLLVGKVRTFFDAARSLPEVSEPAETPSAPVPEEEPKEEERPIERKPAEKPKPRAEGAFTRGLAVYSVNEPVCDGKRVVVTGLLENTSGMNFDDVSVRAELREGGRKETAANFFSVANFKNGTKRYFEAVAYTDMTDPDVRITRVHGTNNRVREGLVVTSCEVVGDNVRTGTVRNDSDHTYDSVHIQFDVFNDENIRVGYAEDTVENLRPGATWVYSVEYSYGTDHLNEKPNDLYAWPNGASWE